MFKELGRCFQPFTIMAGMKEPAYDKSVTSTISRLIQLRERVMLLEFDRYSFY